MMGDLVYLALILVLFLAMVGLVALCDLLGRELT
jgi:hypothetical protein